MTLESALAELYSDRASIERIATDAGLDLSLIAWAPRPLDTWHSVVSQARQQARLLALVAVPLREYPYHVGLHAAVQAEIPAVTAPVAEIPVRVGRLEQRVDGHDGLLHQITAAVFPGPRRRTAVAIFWIMIAVVAASWLIVEIRTWYLANIAQAAIITIAAVIAAFVVRWLPEADHEQER
jgi:hypothetical protein